MLKRRGWQPPSRNTILLNGAVAIVVLSSAAAALRSSVFTPDISPCTVRYLNAAGMSLEREGRPMQVSELQASLSNTDWGLLDRAKVVGLKSGPARQAIAFETGFERPAGADGETRQGVGFVWASQATPPTATACLAYSVFVPEDFDFGSGGRLPGLVGWHQDDPKSKETPFSTRFGFTPEGSIGVQPQLATNLNQDSRMIGGDRGGGRLVPGRWTALEQEVVLGTPGKADSIVRLWVDGALAFERTNIAIRADEQSLITGVLADVWVRRGKSGTKPGVIWVSPFELRW